MPIASRSSCGQIKFRLMPNGREVIERIALISAATPAGSVRHEGFIPKPPALLTAATNSGPTAPAIGARTIGISIPKSAIGFIIDIHPVVSSYLFGADPTTHLE